MRQNMMYMLSIHILILLLVGSAYPIEQIVIEFLYWDPSTSPLWCPECPPWQRVYNDFLNKNETMNGIQHEYGDQVLVKWIEYDSEEGREKRLLYNVTHSDSAIINREVKIEGNFNESYIREVINAYLGKTEPPSQNSRESISLLATFSLGFFETFSPCLIVLVSFILGYTVGGTPKFKEGLFHVVAFGAGFASAAMFLAVMVILIFISVPLLQPVLMWIACVLAMFFGIAIILLALLNKPFQTKPLVQKLARKYYASYIGLFLLGFLFYFLDPCIAPLVFPMLIVMQSSELILSLLMFCLGVIVPFIGIGILAGSISKLVIGNYRHRSKIRVVSGFIMVAYALYLIVFVLPR